MTPKVRKILLIVLIAVLVIGLGLGIYFLFIRDTDPSWRIRDIGASELVHHREYENSRLFIHSNGTFEIEILQKITGENDRILFTGIGTYTRDGNTYTFTFIDSFTDTLHTGARQLERDETRPPYQVVGRRIRFDSHWGISYYFGR